MPTLRWDGDGRFTDNQRDFIARPGTEYDLSEEQAEQYRSHALFGEDWVDVDGETDAGTESDPASESDTTEQDTEESTDESEETVEDDFTMLNGVGDATAEHLRDAGYTTFDDLLNTSAEELADVDGITESKAVSIHEQLSEG